MTGEISKSTGHDSGHDLTNSLRQEPKETMQVPLFEPKLQRQLQRLEQMLKDSGRSCSVELMGVLHSWDAGLEIIGKAKNAQMVTLELTRNIVNTGLADKESRILERNQFWGSLVKALRTDNEAQLVKGIEVNQTVRVASKRLSLHCRDMTLAPSFFTFELKSTDSKDLMLCQDYGFITPLDILAFKQCNWVIVESKELSYTLMELVTKVLEEQHNNFGKTWPMKVTEDLYLASYTNKKPSDGRWLITFMKEPDQSLLRAKELIEDVLSELNMGLTRMEKKWISLDAMEMILLSHAELKEAKEIFNCLYQYARNHPEEKQMHLLHIGGAMHSAAIGQALQSNLTGESGIEVSLTADPRFNGHITDASFSAFFHDRIPFNELLSGVKAKGYEVYAEPERIEGMVRKALAGNRAEFEKRLLIHRITEKDRKEYKTLARTKELNRMMTDLSGLDSNSLHVKYLNQLRVLETPK